MSNIESDIESVVEGFLPAPIQAGIKIGLPIVDGMIALIEDYKSQNAAQENSQLDAAHQHLLASRAALIAALQTPPSTNTTG